MGDKRKMTDKEEIKFAIRYLKKGLKSKRTPPLYEELMNELGFEKKVHNLSDVAEDFFKENYPEYVTEKGECLSPYWDLFSAGVICATFELNNKIAELKAYNEKLLNGDIEKHNKIVELESQIEKMKNELHQRITSQYNCDSDLLDKIVGLDRLWQFGQEF